jgi:hypothetical protein
MRYDKRRMKSGSWWKINAHMASDERCLAAGGRYTHIWRPMKDVWWKMSGSRWKIYSHMAADERCLVEDVWQLGEDIQTCGG